MPSREMTVSSVSPGDVLHDDEEDVVLFFGRENRDDIGMAERGEKPRLMQQIAEVDVLAVRNLDRDFLVDPGVFGEINGAESAAAKRGEDLVLADRLSSEKHERSIQALDLGSGL